MGRLVFSREAMRVLHAHLIAAFPEEGCGLLVGEDQDGLRRVALADPVENAATPGDRARRYDIRPERFLAAERRARGAGLEVVGFFHSHPGSSAEPSAFDRERAWPHYTYAIAGVAPGRIVALRCWRLGPAGFEAEDWIVTEDLGGVGA